MGLIAATGCDSLFGVVCTQEVRPGIVITVTDLARDAPLMGDARVVALDGLFADTARYGYVEGEVSHAGLAWEREGTYRVIVNADGYAQWRDDDVKVDAGPCHVTTVRLVAELEPLG